MSNVVSRMVSVRVSEKSLDLKSENRLILCEINRYSGQEANHCLNDTIFFLSCEMLDRLYHSFFLSLKKKSQLICSFEHFNRSNIFGERKEENEGSNLFIRVDNEGEGIFFVFCFLWTSTD
jgi:hypothetical protein